MKVILGVICLGLSGITFILGYYPGYHIGYTAGYKVGQSNSNIMGDGVYFGINHSIPNEKSIWQAVVRYNGTNHVVNDTNGGYLLTWGKWEKFTVSIDHGGMRYTITNR